MPIFSYMQKDPPRVPGKAITNLPQERKVPRNLQKAWARDDGGQNKYWD